MLKKIIVILTSLILICLTIQSETVTAAPPEIEQNDNTFLIHINTDTDWTNIYFTYPRYTFNIYVNGEKIDSKNQDYVYFCGIGLNPGDIAKFTIPNHNKATFDVELIPTGKFIENTEVLIGGEYFLLQEKEVNGCSTYGDMNRDNVINVADLVLLQKYLLGYKMENPIIPCRGDVVRDNQVDVFDMVELRKRVIENGLKN